jgi:hypothetical protein
MNPNTDRCGMVDGRDYRPCKYFVRYGSEHKGDCRFAPPSKGMQGSESFPVVHASRWCGQHQPLEHGQTSDVKTKQRPNR